jgi:hypothetical protein
VALTEIQKAQVDKLLTAYCAKRVPAPVRPKIRVGYRIDGNAVILYEARPAFQPPHNWQEMVVAKFMYVGTRREWRRRAVEFRGAPARGSRCLPPAGDRERSAARRHPG